MKFKHKITGETVTIRNGDTENVWYTKDSDPKRTLLLLQANVFFAGYARMKQQSNKKVKSASGDTIDG